MSLGRPYYRIVRPSVPVIYYVHDNRYAQDMLQLRRSYFMLEEKLNEILNYIEPDERNLNVFSMELYSLLLRACTEVELNCKLILKANDYHTNHHYSMRDYMKIERSSYLSKYVVKMNNWKKNDNGTVVYSSREFTPFGSFRESVYQSPEWYIAYNSVKHNREEYMHVATLKNCIHAVAGVLVLLYSQFGASIIHQSSRFYLVDGRWDIIPESSSIFYVIQPKVSDFNQDELYEFNWEVLQKENTPFDKFCFNDI